MENNPLISVIIPIYNVEKYLHKCIDSIINQSYRNLEIILVDDGSPDNCGKICDEYVKKDYRIKVIHKENGGLSDARNSGMKISKGDYIAFVDSDDWLDCDLYEKIIKKSDNSDDIIIFGLRYIGFDSDIEYCSNLENSRFEINDENIMPLLKLVKTSMLGYAWNKLYKKEIIKNTKFDDIRLREDICFNFKILKYAKYIRCVNICGYNYLQQPNSILHKSSIKNLKDINKVYNVLHGKIEGINTKNNSIIYNEIMQMYLSDIIMRDVIRNGEITEVEKIKYIKKIFSYRNIVKRLNVRLSDNKLLLLMVLCMKLNMYLVFYNVINRIVFKEKRIKNAN